jgi:hypothetical protein
VPTIIQTNKRHRSNQSTSAVTFQLLLAIQYKDHRKNCCVSFPQARIALCDPFHWALTSSKGFPCNSFSRVIPTGPLIKTLFQKVPHMVALMLMGFLRAFPMGPWPYSRRCLIGMGFRKTNLTRPPKRTTPQMAFPIGKKFLKVYKIVPWTQDRNRMGSRNGRVYPKATGRHDCCWNF